MAKTKTDKKQIDFSDDDSSSSSSSSSSSDSDSDSDSSSSSGSDDKDGTKEVVHEHVPTKKKVKPSLVINKKFAQDFEKRKRREELSNERHDQKNGWGRGHGHGGDRDSDDDESTSESEDEDADLLTPKVDLQILKTINALRKKKDIIYDKDAKFFHNKENNDDDDDNDENSEKSADKKDKKRKQKPYLYKDMVREEIMEKMEKDGDRIGDHVNDDESDDNDDDDGRGGDRRYDISSMRNRERVVKLAYDDEQKALRAEFMNGKEKENGSDKDDDDDDDDGWLVTKKGSTHLEDDGNGNELSEERMEEIKALADSNSNDNDNDNDSDEFVDPKGEVKDGDKFLLDFITNKRWVDPDQDEYRSDSDDDGPSRPRIIGGEDDGDGNGDAYDSDASLKEVDRTDAFESKYNFRFEEANANAETSGSGAGLSVVAYSRTALSDTIRRKDETRKIKRQKHKERKVAERKKKEERLRRLKNAKREELEERITKIKTLAGTIRAPTNSNGDKPAMGDDDDDGGGGGAIDEETVAKLMEGDFDPDKFEELMSKMYSDDFYGKEDAEWKSDVDVKNSMKDVVAEVPEDEEVEGGLYDDVGEMAHDGVGDGDGDGDDDGDVEGEEVGEDYDMGQDDEQYEYQEEEAEPEESKLDKKLKSRMMDELYKLDYEDIIGDMPTRFKYRQVEANRYGLRPDEILFAKDTSLKQFVSLKRMAPYIEDGEYVPGYKRRRRFRDMLKDDYGETLTEDVETQQKEGAVGASADAPVDGITADEQPKKKKRRRQKKGKKHDKEDEKEAVDVKDVSKEETKVPKKEDGNDLLAEKVDTTQEAAVMKEIQVETKVKRSRKKKGKKTKSSFSEKSAEESLSNKDDEKDKKKKKERKKKKSKREKEIPGVSSSRLASYGLY
uniref:Kri1-like C-terminal domain-containing protein n=1 Tax=Chaetoceros debilis TaxID=122233 RepID=A0A7S3QAF1_9STRA